MSRFRLSFLFLVLCILIAFFYEIKMIRAKGSIHIKADGSVEGTDKIQRVGNLYTFTSNIEDSIVVERDDIIIYGAGYTLQGVGDEKGIDLNCRNNVTIKNLEIVEFTHGIYLDKSSENTILNNYIKYNVHGIMLWWESGKNIISGNNITDNRDGIYFAEASGNIIIRNNIVNNTCGIYSWVLCFNNRIYHNNFIHNTKQTDDLEPVYVPGDRSKHIWDNGYPSGGNYWSHFHPVDVKSGSGQNLSGSDGITDYGETAHNTGIDKYPLIAPIRTFNAGVWEWTQHYVDVISNSSTSSFHFNSSEGPSLRFNITGPNYTAGLCRVTVPKELLWTENGWNITVDGQQVTPNIVEDNKSTYMYFTYNHSTKTVEIRGTHSVPGETPDLTLVSLDYPHSISIDEDNKTFSAKFLLRNDGEAEANKVRVEFRSNNANLSMISSEEKNILPSQESNLSAVLRVFNTGEEYVSNCTFNVIYETASGKKRSFETPNIELTVTPQEDPESTHLPVELIAAIVTIIAIGVLAMVFLIRRRKVK